MDARVLKQFVNDHPEGVRIRMVDGTEYVVPHRDFIWFTPAYGLSDAKAGRFATCFYVAEEGIGRLVNAGLVTEVVPLRGPDGNGNGHGKSGRGKKK